MSNEENKKVAIYTSQPGWLRDLAAAYKKRETIVLYDDARIGVDPQQDSIMSMGLKAKVTPREWISVLISLGVAGLGAWVIVMAVLDPEPYTKVITTIAAGAILLGSGGFLAVKVLTDVTPPKIRVSLDGSFEIGWD